jgi:hypothetical protein
LLWRQCIRLNRGIAEVEVFGAAGMTHSWWRSGSIRQIHIRLVRYSWGRYAIACISRITLIVSVIQPVFKHSIIISDNGRELSMEVK